MESIGEKLRTTREEKNLSVDQVARDTNIARRYILALEDEAFSEFPGEPYLIGFLRNYSDYLGLNAEEIVGLYKNFKIQEQPVPMEELLEPKRSKRSPLIFVLIVLIVLLIVAAVLFLPQLTSKGPARPAPAASAAPAAGSSVYQLKDEIVERRFVSGDTVVVPVGNASYKVELKVSGRNLILTDARGTQTIKLGEEKSIDLNGDGSPDLKVFLRDIDTQDPAKGVIVRFDRFTQSPKAPSVTGGSTGASKASPAPPGQKPAATTAQTPAPTQPARAAATAPAAQPQLAAHTAQPAAQQAPRPQVTTPAPQTSTTAPSHAAAGPQTSTSTAGQAVASPQAASTSPSTTATAHTTPAATAPKPPTPVVIASDPAPTPFSVRVAFTGNCLFRYLVDGQRSTQRFFQKGQTARLEVQNRLDIWASNGGALSVEVAGNHVNLGTPGEVVARKITWAKDTNSGGYQLQLTQLQ